MARKFSSGWFLEQESPPSWLPHLLADVVFSLECSSQSRVPGILHLIFLTSAGLDVPLSHWHLTCLAVLLNYIFKPCKQGPVHYYCLSFQKFPVSLFRFAGIMNLESVDMEILRAWEVFVSHTFIQQIFAFCCV